MLNAAFKKEAHTKLLETKKLHGYTDALVNKISKILQDARLSNKKSDARCSKVNGSCDFCAPNGGLAAKKKVSLKYVDEAFNQLHQKHFLVTTIQSLKKFVSNIVSAVAYHEERESVANKFSRLRTQN